MDTKYIVMIQCDIAHRRCSGFACTNTFYNREDTFEEYGEDVRYISFTCGGCCGKGVTAKLEQFAKQLKRKNKIGKEEVVIHLASCMVTDNHHYDRCPHVDYIKSIVAKKGYTSVVEGTYFSKNSSRKREQGIYQTY